MARLTSSLIITLALSMPVVVSVQKSDWNGISPLRSTRDDVEHKLGQSEDSCRCLYRTAKETVFVEYAKASCKGPLFGWNVKADTVLQITVHPNTKQRFSDLSIDERKYVRTGHDGGVTDYYTSVDDGVRYAVQNGEVVYVEHRPSSKDKQLRCEGFPDYDGGIRVPPVRQFFNKSPND